MVMWVNWMKKIKRSSSISHTHVLVNSQSLVSLRCLTRTKACTLPSQPLKRACTIEKSNSGKFLSFSSLLSSSLSLPSFDGTKLVSDAEAIGWRFWSYKLLYWWKRSVRIEISLRSFSLSMALSHPGKQSAELFCQLNWLLGWAIHHSKSSFSLTLNDWILFSIT